MFLKEKIKEARLEKKITQKELAKELTKLGRKTSNTAISNWESGLNSPDIDTLQLICQILGKDGNYFFEKRENYIQDDSSSLELLSYYEKLNDLGKIKALENIKDLSEISKYTEKKTGLESGNV